MLKPTQQKLLKLISKKPYSISQLHTFTKIPKNSIRARISELRKLGYPIQKVDGKYILNGKTTKLESWLNDREHFGKLLNINTISSELQLSKPDVISQLSNLFNRYHVLQISKNEVRIFK